jgi:hypothetical protein
MMEKSELHAITLKGTRGLAPLSNIPTFHHSNQL